MPILFANDEILRLRQSAQSDIGEMPPLPGVVLELARGHDGDQKPPIFALFLRDLAARRVAHGIEAVEARAHVKAVVGVAIRACGITAPGHG